MRVCEGHVFLWSTLLTYILLWIFSYSFGMPSPHLLNAAGAFVEKRRSKNRPPESHHTLFFSAIGVEMGHYADRQGQPNPGEKKTKNPALLWRLEKF